MLGNYKDMSNEIFTVKDDDIVSKFITKWKTYYYPILAPQISSQVHSCTRPDTDFRTVSSPLVVQK